MQLKDFFSFADLVRVMLIGSALLLLIGGVYSIFLHSMYATQVDQVSKDLTYIKGLMETKSQAAYSAAEGQQARDYKAVADRAEELAGQVTAPSVSPNAYTYLNYWIASAAFTKLTLNPKILGLPDQTVQAFAALDSEEVLGRQGWWGRQEFRGYDMDSGQFKVFLEKKPELETNFWTFYLFVFAISVFTVFVCVKEEYELPLIPEMIYGLFLPVLFFIVYSLASIASLIGIVNLLDPSQVDMFVLMLSFVIMCILSAVGALVAALLKSRKKKDRE